MTYERVTPVQVGHPSNPMNERIGQFINEHLWSDAHVYGRIIGTYAKTGVIVERWKAKKDPSFKPQIVAGGFAGHCVNQSEQEWIYSPDADRPVERFRWSQTMAKRRFFHVSDEPYEYYDYNF